MRTEYIKFFKKLFILIAVMFIVDRGLGSILQYYFEREPLGDAASFAHAINDPKEDILIYGSSRAVHTYDTRIFTDSLHLSAYNCGRNGSNVIYGSAILPGALESDKLPKLIILDVFAKEIAYRSSRDGADMLAAAILPYVLINDHFAALARDLFPKELTKARVSKLYAYNSQILSIIRNYSRMENDNINGYQPLVGSKIKGEPPNFSDRDGIDEYSKGRLEYFVKSVTDKKIPLIVILSPMYNQPFTDNESLRVTKEILQKYDVPFWDYSTDPRFVKAEYFYDIAHLNTEGAEAFSKEVVTRIKEMGVLK